MYKLEMYKLERYNPMGYLDAVDTCRANDTPRCFSSMSRHGTRRNINTLVRRSLPAIKSSVCASAACDVKSMEVSRVLLPINEMGSLLHAPVPPRPRVLLPLNLGRSISPKVPSEDEPGTDLRCVSAPPYVFTQPGERIIPFKRSGTR